MRSLFSNLVFLALIIGAWFGVRQYVNPYDYRDYAPDWVMAVPLGGRQYYFPIRLIEPRYPHDEYAYGAEPVLWMNLEPKTFMLLPQPKGLTAGASDRIDVALSSDRNPDTKKVTEAYKLLAGRADGFKPAQHDLKVRKDGKDREYLGKATRISCTSGKCLLFSMPHPEVRIIAYFDEKHLPQWRKMAQSVLAGLTAAERKPPFTANLQAILPEPVARFFKGAAADMKKNVANKG